MSKKNKGSKPALPAAPPEGMDERNAVYVGRRVAVRGIRSPIMVCTGIRGKMIRTTWFDEKLRQAEGIFHPAILVIVPEEHEKEPEPLECGCCGAKGDDPCDSDCDSVADPLETLKATQDAAAEDKARNEALGEAIAASYKTSE
jgi:hypothetical protein